jgi:hypothetical protein
VMLTMTMTQDGSLYGLGCRFLWFDRCVRVVYCLV